MSRLPGIAKRRDAVGHQVRDGIHGAVRASAIIAGELLEAHEDTKFVPKV
jgi:hypothetical protein